VREAATEMNDSSLQEAAALEQHAGGGCRGKAACRWQLQMGSLQEAAADGQQREESRAADLWSNNEHRWIDESWLQWMQQLWCFGSGAGRGSVSKGADYSRCSSFGVLEEALVVAASAGLQD
jgi:hypothetical protein